ncbi:MAG: dethiobiotin synthase [Spirochaetes bacterium]|nr:dethiobiotin synthase [Spirochaetota bacterium]
MPIFVTGTGTNVGKTFFSALVLARYAESLGLFYWKPIQTGADDDALRVQTLSGCAADRILPGFARYTLAASPHYAAECEGTALDIAALQTALAVHAGRKGIIELAGGLMVPLTRTFTNCDLLQRGGLPAVLVADTELGTINHSLLSLAALKNSGIECHGIFFVGRDNHLMTDNMRTICELGGVQLLGNFILPPTPLSPAEFRRAAVTFDAEGLVAAALV